MGRSVYARIADLRAAGLSDTVAYPDDRLVDLLELAAETVEALTQQFFGPRYLTVMSDGLGRIACEEPDRNRIIELESIAVKYSDGSTTPLDPQGYAVMERRIQLRPFDRSPWPYDRAFRALPDHRFGYDYRSVVWTATFGWLDLTAKFETTLTTALARGDVTVNLTGTSELERNDLLLVNRAFWVIVGDVPTPGVVSIDPSHKPAPNGSSVIRYGQVPRLVRDAVIRTVLANRYQAASDEESAADANKRIRREETDNYEVEFFEGAKGGKVFAGTGDPRADAILSRFRASLIAGSWV